MKQFKNKRKVLAALLAAAMAFASVPSMAYGEMDAIIEEVVPQEQASEETEYIPAEVGLGDSYVPEIQIAETTMTEEPVYVLSTSLGGVSVDVTRADGGVFPSGTAVKVETISDMVENEPDRASAAAAWETLLKSAYKNTLVYTYVQNHGMDVASDYLQEHILESVSGFSAYNIHVVDAAGMELIGVPMWASMQVSDEVLYGNAVYQGHTCIGGFQDEPSLGILSSSAAITFGTDESSIYVETDIQDGGWVSILEQDTSWEAPQSEITEKDTEGTDVPQEVGVIDMNPEADQTEGSVIDMNPSAGEVGGSVIDMNPQADGKQPGFGEGDADINSDGITVVDMNPTEVPQEDGGIETKEGEDAAVEAESETESGEETENGEGQQERRIYVSEQDVSVVYDIEKESYLPGEEVHVSLTAVNNTAIQEMSVLPLEEGTTDLESEEVHEEIEAEKIGSEELSLDVPEKGVDEGDLKATYSFIMPDSDVFLSCETAEVMATAAGSGDDEVAVEGATLESHGLNWVCPERYRDTVKVGSQERTVDLTLSDGSTKTVYAYCLQPSKTGPVDGNYGVAEVADSSKIAKLLYYAEYGGMTWGKDIETNSGKTMNIQQFFADNGITSASECKFMLHLALGYVYNKGSDWNYGTTFLDISGGNYEIKALNSAGVKFVETLVGYMDDLPTPNTEFSKTDLQATYENGVIKSESVKFKSNGGNTATVTLPNGITLVNETTGERLTGKVTINGNETFHLECDGSVTGLQTYTFKTLFATDFDVYKIAVSGKQDLGFAYTSKGKTLTLEVEWPQQAKLAVQKIDAETKEPAPIASTLSFAGAVLGVYTDAACTNLVQQITTNVSGYAESTMLNISQYYVKEIQAPEGYLLSNEVLSYSPAEMAGALVTPTKTVTKNLEEQVIRGSLTLMKFLDDSLTQSELQDLYDSGKLEGIKFTLTHESYNENPNAYNYYDMPLTDRWGSTKTPDKALIYGTWTISESNTPPGYEGLMEGVTFKVTSDGVESKYVVSNKEYRQRIKVIKKDADTGETIAISGAQFQVLDTNGIPLIMPDNLNVNKLTDTFTTDENGEILFADSISAGSYILKEVKAPDGFLVAEPIPFDVDSVSTYDNPVIIEVYDAPQRGKILIRKKDEAGNMLGEGFSFKLITTEDIVDTNGKLRTMEVDGKTVELKKGTLIRTASTNADGTLVFDGLYLGRYAVEEIGSAEHYAVSRDQYQIRLKYDASVETVEVALDVKDEKTSFDLYKVDAENGEEYLEGVKFGFLSSGDIDAFLKKFGGSVDLSSKEDMETLIARLQEHKDEIGELITTYVTDKDGHFHVDNLKHDTTYYIFEMETLAGYNLDSNVYTFNVDANGLVDGKAHYIVKLSNVPNIVEVSKQDITGKEELPGAELEVQNSDGSTVDSWISTTEPHLIKGLAAGKYKLIERTAPDGYATAEEIEFEVTDSLEVKMVTMYDAPLQVCFIKKDAITGQAVEGAGFVLRDEENVLVDAWISSTEPHIIKGLIAGKEYTLTEETAPDGYATAEEVKFTVEDTMDMQTVVMKDSPIQVAFYKQDITTSQEIPGADMLVQDENGDTVDTWISSTEPHIIKGLVAGKKYKLIERTAPDGYATAEEITFTITDTAEIQKVVMKDAPIQVAVYKQDISTKKALEGAELEVIEEDGKSVDTWITTTEPHIIKGVAAGKKYTLIEKKAPNGYAVAEKITFEVKDTAEEQKIIMFDKPEEGKTTTTPTASVGTGTTGSTVSGVQAVKTGLQEKPWILVVVAVMCFCGVAGTVFLGRGKKKK